MHVRRQQLVPVHALQRALGAHADRQLRQLHRRRRRRLRSDDPQGQVEGRLSEHHLRGGRRQRVRHRARLDFRRALSESRLPDHLLRQRAVREHRHSGLVAHAVRRHDDVLASRPEGSRSEDAVPQGPRPHDGGRPSALLRGDRERGLPDRPDEQGAQGPQLQGRVVPDDLHALPEGLRVRDAALDRSRPARRRMRALSRSGSGTTKSASTITASARRACGRYRNT